MIVDMHHIISDGVSHQILARDIPVVKLFKYPTIQALARYLEEAGYDPYSYALRIGLYAGSSSNLNWEILTTCSSMGLSSRAQGFQAVQLRDKDFMCTRVSYRLNLNSPDGHCRTFDVITRIWQEVLGFEQVGIYHNFFDLNGDFLSAAQVIARVKDIFHVDIPLKNFFTEPTVAQLAQKIKTLLVEKIKNLSPDLGYPGGASTV